MHLTKLCPSLWRGLLCLMVAFTGHASAAETGYQLGVARYQQFNKPVLIAALYGPSSPKAEADRMINGEQPFRLLVAIESDSMSPRQFRRLWIEGAAVNLSASQLTNATNDLSIYTSSFKGRLQRGDRVVIDYDPTSGTEVTYNGNPIAAQAGKQLGPVLLRGWVGQVPLSTEFKTALLESGISDTELLLALESLPRRASDSAVAVAPAEPQDSAASEAVIAAAPAAAPAALPTPAATAKSQPKPAAAPSAKPVVEKATVAAQAAVIPKPVAAAPVATKPAAPAVAAQPKPAPKPEPAAVDEEDAIQTAEQLAQEQQFYQKLVREVRHYQTVPFQAFQRQWQDDVRLQVTIDRDGKLQGIEILKPSRYDLFNKQARSAVEKASPFTKIPPELGMKTYTFSVLLDYRLMR